MKDDYILLIGAVGIIFIIIFSMLLKKQIEHKKDIAGFVVLVEMMNYLMFLFL